MRLQKLGKSKKLGPGVALGRPGHDFLKVSVQVGAKMGARWAKLATSCDQVGQDSAKLAVSVSTWEFLGACWKHFGTILAHGQDSRKLTKN